MTAGPLDAEAYGLKSSSSDLIRWLSLQINAQTVAPAWQQAIARTQYGCYQTDAFIQAMMWEYYPLPVSTQQLIAGNSAQRILKGMSARVIAPPRASPRHAWYNKTGSTNGFSAYAVFIPAEKIAVIMLANKAFPNDDRVSTTDKIIQLINP